MCRAAALSFFYRLVPRVTEILSVHYMDTVAKDAEILVLWGDDAWERAVGHPPPRSRLRDAQLFRDTRGVAQRIVGVAGLDLPSCMRSTTASPARCPPLGRSGTVVDAAVAPGAMTKASGWFDVQMPASLLMNIRMPGLDGIGATNQIAADPAAQ